MTRASAVKEACLLSIVKKFYWGHLIVRLMDSPVVSGVTLPLTVHSTLSNLKYMFESYVR